MLTNIQIPTMTLSSVLVARIPPSLPRRLSLTISMIGSAKASRSRLSKRFCKVYRVSMYNIAVRISEYPTPEAAIDFLFVGHGLKGPL